MDKLLHLTFQVRKVDLIPAYPTCRGAAKRMRHSCRAQPLEFMSASAAARVPKEGIKGAIQRRIPGTGEPGGLCIISQVISA